MRVISIRKLQERGERMSSIRIQKISITSVKADAIVNAANSGLWAGGGVCGAIFAAAGHDELQAACNRIGHCDVGSAVITPAFNLAAKYIIHAVGPQWIDGKHHEAKKLYGAYQKSLELAVEKGCGSIAFPLISAGIFGYPLDGAWRKAIQACRDFIEDHPENSIDIIFAVLSDDILEAGNRAMKENAPAFVSEKVSGKTSGDKLRIGGQMVDAVFFHKPEEPNGYLSNWYMSDFDLDGIHFTSTEQYIMYQKCKLFGDEASAETVLATNDPHEQQQIGRNARPYIGNVWSGVRQVAALHGLEAKFAQNEDLKEKLLSTGDAILVECSESDIIWACGISLYDKNRFDVEQWVGQNILGFALMEVRRRIREREML